MVPRTTKGASCVSAVLVTAGIVLLLAHVESPSFAATPPKNASEAVPEQEREIAELNLAILKQQTEIARIELEGLEQARVMAEEKLAEKQAKLTAATLQFENTAQLQKQGITSEQELSLQRAHKDAAMAQVRMAKAELAISQTSIRLKNARITLLEYQTKLAEAQLQRVPARAPDSK
jgi:multidrug resistance efflux pump